MAGAIFHLAYGRTATTMRTTPDQSALIVDALRLTDRELAAVLARNIGHADAESSAEQSPAHGEETPAEDLPRLLVHICHQEGNCTTFLVKPRHVHDHGIVFLHGSYVHRGASCSVLLRASDGSPSQIPATVFRCRHLSGRVHEVIAIFEAPARMSDYLCADGSPMAAAHEVS